MPEGAYAHIGPDKPSYLGITLGALIVILVLLLGGLYLWSTTLGDNIYIDSNATRPTAAENNEPESTNAEAEVETFQALSTSDELGAIEADLDSTNLDNLDTELITIEESLEAEIIQ